MLLIQRFLSELNCVTKLGIMFEDNQGVIFLEKNCRDIWHTFYMGCIKTAT